MKKVSLINLVIVMLSLLIITSCVLIPDSLTVSINTKQSTCKVGDSINVTASISGAENSVTDFSWASPNGGSFSTETDTLQAIWAAPNAPGVYTIKFTVSYKQLFFKRKQVDTAEITVTGYADVTNISGTANTNSITLQWENPEEESFQSTIIKKSLTGSDSEDSWETIYEGIDTETADLNVESGKNYYYKFYAQYTNSKRSQGQTFVFFYPHQNYLSSLTADNASFSDFEYNVFTYKKTVPYTIKNISFKPTGRIDDLDIGFISKEESASVQSGAWTNGSILSLGSNTYKFEVSPSENSGVMNTYTIVIEREEDTITLDTLSVEIDGTTEHVLDISQETVPCQIKNNAENYRIKASYTGDAKLYIDGIKTENNSWTSTENITGDKKTILLELKNSEMRRVVKKNIVLERVPVIPILNSLTFNADSDLALEDFSPQKYTYFVTVPKTLESFQLKPEVEEDQKLTIMVGGEIVESGQFSSPITIDPDTTKDVTINVTAKEDADLKNTYVITFERPHLSENANLADISVSGFEDIGFSPGKISYDLEFPYNTSTVEVSVQAEDSNASIQFRDDNENRKEPEHQNGHFSVSTNEGETAHLSIIVKAEAGNTKKYTLSLAVQPKPDIIVEKPTSSSEFELDNLTSIPAAWSIENSEAIDASASVKIYLYNSYDNKFIRQTSINSSSYDIEIDKEVRKFIIEHYEKHPDDFRVEVVYSEDTSINGISHSFSIEPKLFDIHAEIDNYTEFSHNEFPQFMKADIYKKDGTYYYKYTTITDFDSNTNSEFQLPAGDYRMAVFHKLGNTEEDEYWGYTDFQVSNSEPVQVYFTRDMPIIDSVDARDSVINDDDNITVKLNDNYNIDPVNLVMADVKIFSSSKEIYHAVETCSGRKASLPPIDDQYSGKPMGDVSMQVKIHSRVNNPTGNGQKDYLTDIILGTGDIKENIKFDDECTVTVNNFNKQNDNIDWNKVRVELYKSSFGTNYTEVNTFMLDNTYRRQLTIPDLDYADYDYRIHVFYDTSAKLVSSDYDDEYWGFWDLLDYTNFKTAERFMPCTESINYATQPSTKISDDLMYELFNDSLDYHRNNDHLDIESRAYIYQYSGGAGDNYYEDSKQFNGDDGPMISMNPYKRLWELRKPKRPESMYLFGHVYAEVPDLDGVGTRWLKTDTCNWTDITGTLSGFRGE